MKINLSEIPEEGRTWNLDRTTGELNDLLTDLIEQRNYKVDFTIKPLGNVYELRGSIQTATPELCSRCGWDIEIPLKTKFNEILMHDEEEYRKAHSVHGNQAVDFLNEGPGVTYYQGESFNAGEFIHEAIAFAMPFYPSCGVEDCEHLEEVREKRAELEQEFKKADEVIAGHPGFSILKNWNKN